MALIIDASVMLRWYFEDEQDPTEDILRRLSIEDLVVPAHWPSELANGIVIGERRGRSAVAHVDRLMRLLEELQIEVDEEGAAAALVRILPLARAHGLTVYDAIYLELAERRGLPLATYDGPLAQAAASIGVEVLGVGMNE